MDPRALRPLGLLPFPVIGRLGNMFLPQRPRQEDLFPDTVRYMEFRRKFSAILSFTLIVPSAAGAFAGPIGYKGRATKKIPITGLPALGLNDSKIMLGPGDVAPVLGEGTLPTVVIPFVENRVIRVDAAIAEAAPGPTRLHAASPLKQRETRRGAPSVLKTLERMQTNVSKMEGGSVEMGAALDAAFDGGKPIDSIAELSVERVAQNFHARGWPLTPVELKELNFFAKSVVAKSFVPLQQALRHRHGAAAPHAIERRYRTALKFTGSLPRFILGASPRANAHLTGAFRHPGRWVPETRRSLRTHWIPDAKRKGARELVLRSLGASVGLEPLSLAMLVDSELHRAGEDPDAWDVRIDAMEINPAALVFMTMGRHKAERVEDRTGQFDEAPDLMRDVRRVLGRRAKNYLVKVDGRAGWYELTPEFKSRFHRWLNPVWTDLSDEELHPVVDDGKAHAVFALGIHGVLRSFTQTVQPWLESAGWKRPETIGQLTTTVSERGFWDRRDWWVGTLRLILALSGIRILSTTLGSFKLLLYSPSGDAVERRPTTFTGRLVSKTFLQK